MEFLLSRGHGWISLPRRFWGGCTLVKAFLSESPAALSRTGPHGISLLEHAKKGGDPEMVSYLALRLNPNKGRGKVRKSTVAHGKPSRTKRRKAA